jgi:hypothetical protein
MFAAVKVTSEQSDRKVHSGYHFFGGSDRFCTARAVAAWVIVSGILHNRFI